MSVPRPRQPRPTLEARLVAWEKAYRAMYDAARGDPDAYGRKPDVPREIQAACLRAAAVLIQGISLEEE